MTPSPVDGVICIMRMDVKDDQFRAITTRIFLGFSLQKAFCEETGIDVTSWNLIEKGNRNIGLSQARKIKKAFGLSFDWTLDGELTALPREYQRAVRLALAKKGLPTAAA